MPAACNIWENITYHQVGAETSPFIFQNREYYLMNLSPLHENLPAGTPEHAVIVDVQTGEQSAPLFEDYYFISAYSNPRDGKVYCFGSRVKNGWKSHAIDMICSSDLVNWSQPQAVFEDYPGLVYNTGVTFDGENYVMLVEVRDAGKPFAVKFLKSKDLQNWQFVEGAWFHNTISYLGAGAIYYVPEQKYFYITYLDEFINPQTGDLNYATNIARSSDLYNWERGKRPILSPDYSHEVIGHPGIYEINTSDAEFIELNKNLVKAYSCGGNQLGAHDWYTCEYKGSMQELFNSFFC